MASPVGFQPEVQPEAHSKPLPFHFDRFEILALGLDADDGQELLHPLRRLP
jgi:hypothetical protein